MSLSYSRKGEARDSPACFVLLSLVQVTWQKSNSQQDGDVARLRELVDGGMLTQEIIRLTTKNVRKRNVDIS